MELYFNIIMSKGTWNNEDGKMNIWKEGGMEENKEGEKEEV